MKEIFFIILQLFVFLIFFTTPFNLVFNKITKNVSKNNFYIISLNFIILSNILLFFSFFKLNYNYIFFFQILLSFFLILYFIYKKKISINIFYKNFKIYLFFFFINLTLFFLLANHLRLEWDGLAFWFYKTNAFYQGASFEDLKKGFTFVSCSSDQNIIVKNADLQIKKIKY
jgi:hypothetical protein